MSENNNTKLVIPDHLYIDSEKVSFIQAYLQHLDPMQRKTYQIAMEHLGTSFHIEKSNGFVEWRKKQEQMGTS